MSVSHPLIRELKGHATKLLTESPKPITDENPNVRLLCKCIEKIFYKGLKVHRNVIGILRTPECWHWLERLGVERIGCPYSYKSCIEIVRRCEKVTTDLGRVRLLIRASLTRRCIHIPVQYFLTFPDNYKTLYTATSVLGDEILSQLLLSVLMIVSKLEFKLDLENALFLDSTWHLPQALSLQLVPCTTLGISIMFINGKALIIDVLIGSVAAETGEIMIGDILDTLNGAVINERLQGSLMNILRKAAGQPLSLYIVKGYIDGGLYGPIIPLLKEAGLECDYVLSQYKNELKLNKFCDDSSDKITFVGMIETGNKSDVKQIYIAINLLLKSKTQENVDVLIQCHDLGIKVYNTVKQQVIFEHAYMEISSCGCSTTSPFYFAYIAGTSVHCTNNKEQTLVNVKNIENQLITYNGCYINYLDETRNHCKEFKCFIFHSQNRAQIDTILKTIGQGFRRTLYTV